MSWQGNKGACIKTKNAINKRQQCEPKHEIYLFLEVSLFKRRHICHKHADIHTSFGPAASQQSSQAALTVRCIF